MMAMDGTGHLWAATEKGLFVQGKEVMFYRPPHIFQDPVISVATGNAGSMHVGTGHGLFTFRQNGVVDSWTSADGLPVAGAGLVGEDGAGRIWVCSGRTLVMKASGAARFTDQSKLLTSGVTPFGHFYRDQDGALWLPTMNGAMRLFGEQPTMLDASAGLPMRWVRNVFRDREGGLWILGTALARLQGNNRVWNHPLAAGPSGEIVWSMLKDSHGDLLVGTDDGVVRMGASGPVRIPGTEGHRKGTGL
jgi:ligand-binding sensor domain-containing protein